MDNPEVCPNCGAERNACYTSKGERFSHRPQSAIGTFYRCLKCGWRWRKGSMTVTVFGDPHG